MKSQCILAGASLLALTSAHSTFVQLTAGGVTNPVGYGIRDPSYDGPINDVTTNDIACNGGPNPTTPSANIINVKAGETVQATWRHTLTSTAANDAVYVIDPSHKGPTMAYLKKVTTGSATTDTGIGGGWFKIQEAGLNVASGVWAITDLISNAGIQNIKIPDCIADGQYLLRAEIIALHAAGSSKGAQLYMECAQINVTGGSGASTPATVSFPGAYGQSDPGILINIYQTLTSYLIPGPRPFVCGAGGSVSSVVVQPVTSTTPTPTPTTLATSVKTTSTSTKAATTSAATGGAALYGQCGGIGWTGATTCASGVCKANGAYYSQCVPA